jgi:hypothetical protein
MSPTPIVVSSNLTRKHLGNKNDQTLYCILDNNKQRRNLLFCRSFFFFQFSNGCRNNFDSFVSAPLSDEPLSGIEASLTGRFGLQGVVGSRKIVRKPFDRTTKKADQTFGHSRMLLLDHLPDRRFEDEDQKDEESSHHVQASDDSKKNLKICFIVLLLLLVKGYF